MLTDKELSTPPDWASADVHGMYLFGSRSMALRKGYKDVNGEEFDTDKIRKHLTEYTDYDYAAQYSRKLADRLEANGWKFIDTDGLYHPCKLMKALYVKKDEKGRNVQILLRKNHVLFQTVWDNLDPGFWYHYIWKSSPDFVFRKFKKKTQKKMITEIIDQLYTVYNRQYGFHK